ncbi:MAG: DDE-type integrase/transposase/recombinase [Desulfuromonadales bacterium]|nr:DDE-type integrase/transposase/recombinase [Desulfuromonadales bacterium]
MITSDVKDRQKTVSDFRFGIIADLVYSHAAGKELARLIAEKASRTYDIPFSKKERITQSCIRKWLTAYRTKGRDALAPRIRKDKGSCRAIADGEKELILKLLEQKPQMDASSAVRTLVRDGKLLNGISKSSLSRFIRSSGFDRASRLHVATKDQVQGFSYEYPLECVQVDDMHSFAVPDHTGKLRKAILIAFLDDATRRILYSRFSFSESALEFERGILHILRSHGRPRRLYTDHGSTFISDQTHRILDTLGIPLIHSRAGIPKGRGKVERFFRTVRTQFEITLEPASIRSIQDYDTRFRSWLESEYHRQPHSGLGGRTPLDAYLSGTDRIFRVDPSIDLDEVFCHEDSRVVANDGTVSVGGIHYEVPSILIGSKVKLRRNPHADLPVISVYRDGKAYGNARRVDVYANARSRRLMDQDDPSQVAFRSSKGDARTTGGR